MRTGLMCRGWELDRGEGNSQGIERWVFQKRRNICRTGEAGAHNDPCCLAVNVQAQTLSSTSPTCKLHGSLKRKPQGIDGGKEDAGKRGLETIEQPADLLPGSSRWNFVFVLCRTRLKTGQVRCKVCSIKN